MFCNMCGRQIDDNAAFCTWCGAKMIVPEAPKPAVSVPEPAAFSLREEKPEPVTAEMDVPAAEARGEKQPEYSGAFSEREEGSEKIQESLNDAEAVPKAPLPRVDPSWNQEVPLSEKAPEAATPAEEEKPRKYYTGAHLAICLVTTGIMAVIAGVFAGLYFSAIM